MRNARNKQLHFSYITLNNNNQALIPKFLGLDSHISYSIMQDFTHLSSIIYHIIQQHRPSLNPEILGCLLICHIIQVNFHTLVTDLDCLWIQQILTFTHHQKTWIDWTHRYICKCQYALFEMQFLALARVRTLNRSTYMLGQMEWLYRCCNQI